MIKKLPQLALLITVLACISMILKTIKQPITDSIFMMVMFSLAGVLYFEAFTIKIPKPLFMIYVRIAGIGLAVAVVGILFRFLFWKGWQTMLPVGELSALAVIPVMITASKIKQEFSEQYRALINGLLIPAVFVLFCAFMVQVVPDKTIYETFSTTSLTKSYDQFHQEQLEQMKHHNHR